MSACVQLCSILAPEGAEEQDHDLRLEMNTEAIKRIEEQFQGCGSLVPVVVIGNSRKSFILDKLLGRAHEAPFTSFDDFKGVIAYPEPVQTENNQLFLIEMSSMDFEEEGKGSVLERKILHALLSVASVCIVCLESKKMLAHLTDIMQIYEGMQNKSKLALSKFFICVDSQEALKKAQGYNEFVNGKWNSCSEFLFRGRGDFNEEQFQRMKNLIHEKPLHAPFENTHEPFRLRFSEPSAPPPMIVALTSLLTTLWKLSTLDTSLDDYIAAAPDVTLDFSAQVTQITELINLTTVEVGEVVQLVSLEKPQEGALVNSVPGPRTEIEPDVLGQLEKQFSGCKHLVPILVIGNSNCGKRLILDKILRQSKKRPFSSFKGSKGVVVFSDPVQAGPHQLLLMEMSGVNYTAEAIKHMIQEDSKEQPSEEQKCLLAAEKKNISLSKKTLHALLAISSVCIICLKGKFLFEDLDTIMEIYQGLQEKSKLALSKFFICIKSEEMLQVGFQKFSNGSFKKMCEFFYRGRHGFDEKEFKRMIGLIHQENFHEKFDETHQPCLKLLQDPGKSDPLSMIKTLSIIFGGLRNLSKSDFTLKKHLKSAPDFTLSFTDQKAIMEEEISRFDSIHTLKTLPFFKRASHAIEIDLHSMEELNKNYKEKEPIVVISFLGHQGVGGKSTLINCIVQYLLGARVRKDICKEGIRTINSHVLSHPLKLSPTGPQLMFIDLESLESLETNTGLEKTSQRNLVSGVLAVSSVYCLFVKNETDSIDFVQKILIRIAFFQHIFRVKVDLVLLIFHDKDPDLETKHGFVDSVNEWNQRFFRGMEVIKVLNKPNFSDPAKSPLLEGFLRQLISEFQYPKERLTGEILNIFEVIKYMTLISQNPVPETSLPDLSESDKKLKNVLLQVKLAEIDRIFQSVQCENEHFSLVDTFSTDVDLVITSAILSIQGENSSLFQHVFSALYAEKAAKRILLIEVENFFKAIWGRKTKEIREKAAEFLNFAYGNYVNVEKFRKVANKLREKMTKVSVRYPFLSTQIAEIIQYIDPLALQLEMYMHQGRPEADSRPQKSVFLYSNTLHVNLPEPRLLEKKGTGSLLLIVGRKNMNVHKFLNEFIKYTFPLDSNYQKAFNDKARIQVLSFPQIAYQQSLVQPQYRFGVIIYIRLKRKSESDKAKRLSMLTATLMTKATLTYLIYDLSPESLSSLDDILTAYRPQDRRQVRLISSDVHSADRSNVDGLLIKKNVDYMNYRMAIPLGEEDWKEHFSVLNRDVFNGKLGVDNEELRDVVTQAKDFYLQIPALSLYRKDDESDSIRLNQDFVQSLTDSHYKKEMAVLLVVGRAKKGIDSLLNEFLKSTFPIAVTFETTAFNDKNPFQVHYFPLEMENHLSVRQGVLVYIRMKAKTKKPEAAKLMTMAAMYIAKSTLAHFFVDSDEEMRTYLRILDTCHPSQHEGEKPHCGETGTPMKEKWAFIFEDWKTQLRQNSPLSPQEVKDLVIQAQKFHEQEPAFSLYQDGEFSYPNFIDSDVTSSARREAPHEQMGILLLIGRKNMNIDGIASRFIRNLYSVPTSTYLPFNDTTRIQAMNFIVRDPVGQVTRQILVLYIRMKGKLESKKAKNMAAFAATVLSKSALTCCFLNSNQNPTDYLESIMKVYQPQTGLERKVCVYSPRSDGLDDLKAMFQAKSIILINPETMRFNQSGDMLQEQFLRSLFSERPISAQEGKALLVQAQRFFQKEAAVALYEKVENSLSINNEFIRRIERLSENFVTLLAVGRKSSKADVFLNNFMEWNFSLSRSCCSAFTEESQIQAVSFHMRGANLQREESEVLIMYIRLEEKADTPKAKRLLKLATALVSPAILPCLFLNSVEERDPEILNILSGYEGKKGSVWVTVPPSENEAASTSLRNYFLEQNIEVDVQHMNISEVDNIRAVQFPRLTADLLKLTPLTPTELICTLRDAGNQANKAS